MYPYRQGKVLTPDAEAEYLDFEQHIADMGCRCCVSPPCEWCVHPGNPINLYECDDCWVDEDIIDAMCEAAIAAIAEQIDKSVEQQLAAHRLIFDKYSPLITGGIDEVNGVDG